MARHARGGARRLEIDPVRCDGTAICAHIAPSIITLDSWGYPIVAANELSTHETRAASAAVAACPRRALFLDHSTVVGAANRR